MGDAPRRLSLRQTRCVGDATPSAPGVRVSCLSAGSRKSMSTAPRLGHPQSWLEAFCKECERRRRLLTPQMKACSASDINGVNVRLQKACLEIVLAVGGNAIALSKK